MAEEKTKKKLHRRDFAALRDLIKKRDDANLSELEVLDKVCDEHSKKEGATDWWPDKVNIGMGFVELPCPDGNYRDRFNNPCNRERIVGKPLEQIRAATKKSREAQKRVDDKLAALSGHLKVPVSSIDPKTGEIKDDKVEVAEAHEESPKENK